MQGDVTDEAIKEAIKKGQPLIEDAGDGDYWVIYSAYMKGYIKDDAENTKKQGLK